LKAKLLTFLAVAVFIFSSIMLAQAETGTSIWREEMNYQSLDQLKAGGWTVTHEDGVSFSGSAIILDGTSQDTSIHYSNHFSSGIPNWRVEDRSHWTLGSHCGNSVTAITNKHSYAFMADGWYGNYVFYRDGQKTTFGNYQESKNTWFTLAIEKQGNQISMYYNGEIKSTYTETDDSPSQLTGVDAVSPWRGGSEYDYFEVWQIGDTSTQEAQESLLNNPIVIGGIIGAVGVGVGGVLYFFVLGGSGSAGASGGAGGVGGAGSGSGTQGNVPPNHSASQGGGTHPQTEPDPHVSIELDPPEPEPDLHVSIDLDPPETQPELHVSIDLDPPQTEPDPHVSIDLNPPEHTVQAGTQGNTSSEQTQLMNQSQQNDPNRLQTNSETVTQQTQILQDSAVNVVSTPGQNVPQTLDKALKPNTNAKKSTADGGQ
jgi:hypothetical protein